MSRSALVSYEFVDFNFLNFGDLKIRLYTALHLSFRYIYWTISNVWLLKK